MKPNGARAVCWAPDPRNGSDGYLYVADLGGVLWKRNVSATRVGEWECLVRPKKKQRGKVQPLRG